MSDARPFLQPSQRSALAGIALVCLGGLGAGLVLDPERGWSSFLTAGFYYLTISLGGVVLLALHIVAKSAWIVPVKRVAEAMGGYLAVGAATMLLVLPGVHTLYPWSHHDHVEHDPILKAKSAYLNVPAFGVRMLVALLIWIAFAAALRARSRRQDQDGDPAHSARSVALAAGFLGVFGLTFSMASFDWMMSLSPHWQSTIFGFYNIAGLLVAGVSTLTTAVVFLRRRGHLPGVTKTHLHNLGKLMLGFSTLWAYMWLSQYLLIWYANLPEETPYYLARTSGGWAFLFWGNLVIGWAVPFLMLLRSRAKRTEGVLLVASVVLLIARWLDIYLMVTPSNIPVHPGIGLLELAGYLGFGALFVLVVERALRAAPLLPRGDPYLEEGLHAS